VRQLVFVNPSSQAPAYRRSSKLEVLLCVYKGHTSYLLSQAMAGAPILHMACVLPRIDSGAAYPVCRLPTGHALAHGKPKQPPAAAAAAACKAGGASPQARSESANNTDIGGVSGGFFNEAEAGAGNS